MRYGALTSTRNDGKVSSFQRFIVRLFILKNLSLESGGTTILYREMLEEIKTASKDSLVVLSEQGDPTEKIREIRHDYPFRNAR